MDSYTDQERKVLTARQIDVDFGLELLDDDDRLLDEIGDDLIGGTVDRELYRAVHGSCDLSLLADYSGRRVRPWQSVTAAAGTVRRPLGVFLLTTPERDQTDDDRDVWSTQGVDKLHTLQHQIADTYVVGSGTSYLTAVRDAITAAGSTGLAPYLDGTAVDATLDGDRVWVCDPDVPVSWLRVVNDLLSEIGYRGLWVDRLGRFRSEPYRSPAVRATEWDFDLTDPRTSIVDPTRKLTRDSFDGFNFWRFVREGDVRPVDGNGRYTVDRSNGSQLRPRFERLQVADHAALVARGDQLVDADTRSTQLLEITTGPLPIVGHADVARYVDPELGTLRVQTRTWRVDLAAGSTDLTLEIV